MLSHVTVEETAKKTKNTALTIQAKDIALDSHVSIHLVDALTSATAKDVTTQNERKLQQLKPSFVQEKESPLFSVGTESQDRNTWNRKV